MINMREKTRSGGHIVAGVRRQLAGVFVARNLRHLVDDAGEGFTVFRIKRPAEDLDLGNTVHLRLHGEGPGVYVIHRHAVDEILHLA